MRTRPARRGLAAGTILLLAVAGVISYLVTSHGKPPLTGTGCKAGTGRQAVSLDYEQASIAATIAGVAHRLGMPARAVVIAYAAAIQESGLHNLNYGDRDSVGVFQQRPSQGWGPAARLLDPVYASTRFFQALAQVPGYRHKPVYLAAQAVQRSADGYAYNQYQPVATKLAADFTGQKAHAVWCWPAVPDPVRADLTAASRNLTDTFGPVGATRLTAPRGGRPALAVPATSPAQGWAVAAWLITHAAQYRLHEVRYLGLRWQAAAGGSGWTPSKAAAHRSEVLAS